MVADFALTLACGLALITLVIPWRMIPTGFFRTQSLVIMGLGILAGMDLGFSRAGAGPVTAAVLCAVVGYMASVCWGLGLPRFGLPLLGILGVGLALWLGNLDYWGTVASAARPDRTALWGALNVASRWASAGLLGGTLTAMLLGHHYLTAPAMSISPLMTLIAAMAVTLAIRAALAGAMLAHALGSPSRGDLEPWFLAIRWGVGVLGVGLATVLAWNTARIRSTQSATGILYIAMTLVLFGELTSLILARQLGYLV